MKNTLLMKGIVLLLGLFLFSACQEDEIDSTFFRTDGALSATLKDANDAPIADAKVSLYNLSTGNRIAVEYSTENGTVNFGRFEAGEYSIGVELTHNEEWFSFREEVHVISGTEVTHEINLADQYGDVLVRLRDSNTGELIEVDLGLSLGFVPYSEDFYLLESDEEIIASVKNSSSAQVSNDLVDMPVAAYLVILYSNDKIYASDFVEVDAFDRSFVNFYLNPLNLLLESKSSWVLTSVTAETENSNLVPISSLTFEDGEMIVNFSNGESDPAGYDFYGNGNFYWYSVGNSSYSFYFNTSTYTLNSNGSITFNFDSWETYNYNTGQNYYSNNVSLTFN